MKLVEIHRDVFVDPNEVISVEHDVVRDYKSSCPSDDSMYEKFNGSKIFLKNGRKIHINGVMPKTIINILQLHIKKEEI